VNSGRSGFEQEEQMTTTIRTTNTNERTTASRTRFAYLPCLLALGCSGGDGLSEAVGQVEEEVINGRETWDSLHERYIMQPTVQIRTSNGGVCTGTALRNNIVLTARHCAADGTVDGPLATPSTISVASSQTVPTANCNSANCRTVSAIETVATTQDVALLILSGSINVNGTTGGFGMKIEPFAPEFHENLALVVSGYGRNTAAGGSGTLRQGTVDVFSTNGAWDSPWVNTGRVLETVAIPALSAGGQLMWSGDSGGPYWNSLVIDPANTNITQVPMLLAVHSRRGGSGDGTIAHGTIASAFRNWVNNEIFERTTNISNSLTSSSFLSSLELREPVAGSSGPTNWLINANGLSEASNFNTPYPNAVGTMRVHRTGVFENFDMRVDVSGTDNDSAGMIFWYVDDSNYLRFSVDEERRFARIIRMNPRGPVTLAENTNFSVDYDAGVQLRVVTSGSDIRAFVNGTQVLTARDRNVMIGRVGIYENGMANVAFRNWSVTASSPSTGNVPFP
jgi:hypothetical protein